MRFSIAVCILFYHLTMLAAKPKIAVMEIEDRSGKFTSQILYNATEMLRGFLTATDNYIVIDKTRQQERLKKLVKEKKKDSYRSCYDKNCQIPLGQALSADSILRSTISCIENNCVLSLEMIDLAREAAIDGASTDFVYSSESLRPLFNALKTSSSLLGKDGAEIKEKKVEKQIVVAIRTEPKGVKATISKKSFHRECITPCLFENLEPAIYNMTLSANGYHTRTGRVKADKPGIKYVSLTMQENKDGVLSVLLSCLDKKDYQCIENKIRSKDVDINYRDSKKRTLLMLAGAYNDKRFAEILVQNDADISAEDEEGKKAVDYAPPDSELYYYLGGVQKQQKNFQQPQKRIRKPLKPFWEDYHIEYLGAGLTTIPSFQAEIIRINFRGLLFSLLSCSYTPENYIFQPLSIGLHIADPGDSEFDVGGMGSLLSFSSDEGYSGYLKAVFRFFASYTFSSNFKGEIGFYVYTSNKPTPDDEYNNEDDENDTVAKLYIQIFLF